MNGAAGARRIRVNYETWNRYVLIAIGLFAVVYVGLLYASFMEFRARISKSNGDKKRSRNWVTARRLHTSKVSGH